MLFIIVNYYFSFLFFLLLLFFFFFSFSSRFLLPVNTPEVEQTRNFSSAHIVTLPTVSALSALAKHKKCLPYFPNRAGTPGRCSNENTPILTQ